MIIKKININNFRQFKGSIEFVFPVTKEKNVNVILGDNSFGKTTILQAFTWCLYDKVNFEEYPDKIYNLEMDDILKVDEQIKVSVEIVLNKNNIDYIIRREKLFVKKQTIIEIDSGNKLTIYYSENDGQTKQIPDVDKESVINEILPETLSSYFFFDTERVKNVSTRSDLAESVKGILGLKSFENAIKHLGSEDKKMSVIGKFYSEKDLGGDINAKNALDTLQVAQDEKDSLLKERDEIIDQIDKYTEKIEKLEQILKDNEQTTILADKIGANEQYIKTLKESLIDHLKAFLKTFNKESIAFFARPLVEKTSLLLQNAEISDKGISDVTKNSIMELIEKGRCLCGNCIEKGNEAYNNLIEMLKYVPPESLGNTIRHFQEDLSVFSKDYENIYDTLIDEYNAIEKTKLLIQKYEDSNDELREKIKGNLDMKHVEEEIENAKKRISDLNDKKDKYLGIIGQKEQIINSNKKIYDSKVSMVSKNKEIDKYISEAKTIAEYLNQMYSKEEKKIKNDLQNEVNEILGRMYHGERKVIINDKYKVELKVISGDRELSTDLSEGTKRVRNFAFIAGLVSLAKKKMEENETENNNGLNFIKVEPCPLVMDAPFSEADAKHIKNISKELPEVADQVIMFVMDKDWQYAREVLSSKVNKIYRLKKISELYTKVE